MLQLRLPPKPSRPWRRRPLYALRRAWAYLQRRQAAIVARRDPYGPLTVGELILQLRRFDPDMRVVMPGEVGDWSDVYEAHLDIFVDTKDWGLGLADDGDADATMVVRLFGSPDDD